MQVFFSFQASIDISSIQHNQISKIKFYIILNVKKKEKKSIKIRKLLLLFFF